VDHVTSFQTNFPDTSKTWAGRETKQDINFTRNLENKIKLSTLSNGINNTEIRIWRLSGSYDPQYLNILRQSSTNNWSLRTIVYYRTKSDSIISDFTIPIRASYLDSLRLDRYWNMPSQSDLTDGDKYGCMDGSNVLIELANSKTYNLKWYRCPDINKSRDSVFLLASELTSRLNAIAENR
ncbi:MAG: hypothetical protein WAU24_14360, partial [Chitinophagaceae bacterium]